jgi:hypothetical protein
MRQHILLLEVFRLQTLLLEGRIDFLKQNFLPRIAKVLEEKTLLIPSDILTLISQQDGDNESEQLFNFVLSCDPDPVKKNSQWLLTQILRKQNAMPMEDLRTASETLTKYDEMKKARQIPANKSDINSFKSLSDLYLVIRGEVQQIQTADEQEKQEMLAQSDVLINDDRILVVSPNTVQAARYWGRNTEWCTAYGDAKGRHPTRTDNYFDYYNTKGKLYVVIEKENKTYWQLHFESGQFMDVNDTSFPIENLVLKYPEIFKAIGEDKFIKYADKFGLSWFSPETMLKFNSYQLSRMIKSKKDLKLVPLEKQENFDFCKAVVNNKPEAIAWFPSKFVFEHVTNIITALPSCFPYLPDILQTQERANEIAEGLPWRNIEAYISKKLWSDEIKKQYWTSKAAFNNCEMQDIPKEYQKDCAVSCFKNALKNNRFPKLASEYPQFLTHSVVLNLVTDKSTSVKAFEEVPAKFLDNSEIADVLSNKIKNERNNPYSKLSDLWARFKPKYWDDAAVKHLINNAKISWHDLPDKFKTPEFISLLVKKNPKEAADIPKEYWNDELLSKLFEPYSNDFLKYVNPDFISEDFIANLAKDKNYKNIYAYLPDQFKSAKVITSFANDGNVAIKSLPKYLMNSENIVKRIANEYTETADIPENLMTKELAVKLVEANEKSLVFIPERVFSTELLTAWLRKLPENYLHTYDQYSQLHKRLFEKFPSSMWTSETVALAIDHGYMEPKRSLFPANLMNRQVAQAIISKNHEDMEGVSGELDDASIIEALKKNWRVLITLPPDKITEPMAYTVMQKFAGAGSTATYKKYRREKNDSPITPVLLNIPKTVWSKRVYQEAVGYVIPLKSVPNKYRDDALTKLAIERNPENIKDLTDPAKFLNQNFKGYGNDMWRQAIEESGCAIIKNKYYNVSGLPKVKLKSGNSYALLDSGKTNVKVFFFDKKDNYKFYLYTLKDKVHVPNHLQPIAEKFKNDIVEMADKLPFINNDLNDIGVYDKPNGGARTEETTPKTAFSNMEWSKNYHKGGYMYVAWSKNKPAIRIYVGASGKGMYGKGDAKIEDVTIYDFPYCLDHSDDIAKYINNKIYAQGGWHQLSKLGILFKKDKSAYSIKIDAVGKMDDLTIYKNKTKIGLFGPKGMIAHGTMYKSGEIGDIKQEDYDINPEVIDKLFNKLSQIIKSKISP